MRSFLNLSGPTCRDGNATSPAPARCQREHRRLSWDLQPLEGARITTLPPVLNPNHEDSPMPLNLILCTLIVSLGTASVWAQDSTLPAGSEPPAGHAPPPHAYSDCQGKKAGDRVSHRTPEGVIPATCMDSPEGLVARPDQPAGQHPPSDAGAQRNDRRPPPASHARPATQTNSATNPQP